MICRLPVNYGGQLPDRLQAIAGVCLRERVFGRLERFPLLRLACAERGLVVGNSLLDFEVLIPDGEDRLSGEGSHCRAVALYGSQGYRARLLLAEPVFPSGDHEARGQSLDIPLEWTRQRLVKVIDVEHQATLW
jgi:hypothetical protein